MRAGMEWSMAHVGQKSQLLESEGEGPHNVISNEFDVVSTRKLQASGQRMDTSDEGGSSTNLKRPSFPPVSAQQAEGVSEPVCCAVPTNTRTPRTIVQFLHKACQVGSQQPTPSAAKPMQMVCALLE